MSKAVGIDVVMVNYRSAQAVTAAVRALQGPGGRWPHGMVRVVDNSEEAGEAQALHTAFEGCPDVSVTVMPRNVGFGAACNEAWAQGPSPYMLLLNPDASITSEAVLRMAQELESRPTLGAASPRTWWDEPGGWVLPCPTAQGPVHRLRRARGSRRNPQRWADEQATRTRMEMTSNSPVLVDMLAGAVLLLRREAVAQAGGLFDPAFFMYFEDAELSQRLRAAGWELAVLPTVDAVHAWRHQPHKAPLMEAGQEVFIHRQAAWYRTLRSLWPAAEAMGRLPFRAGAWTTHEEAARGLGAVSALSPVPSGDPAWVRCGAPTPLGAQEWNLLEPGHYWARNAKGWFGFEKLDAHTADARARCPCCGSVLQKGLEDWHRVCHACAYEQGLMEARISDVVKAKPESPTTVLDEGLRREALEAIRQANFKQVLRLMQGHRGAEQNQLLDVGAAHGWFVKACQEAQPPWAALGLEPDAAVAALAQAEGTPVRLGYFPQALGPDERFDAISFHDVFEHLPDLDDVMGAIKRHLQPGGLLVLNLPSSEGVFFRVARRLARLGLPGPWHRMWQVGMPSPHLHYFNADNLEALLRRHGLDVVERSQLPSIVREGLMARLRFDPRSAWMAPVLGPILWLAVPLLQRLSPDIRVLIARCQAEATPRP